MTRANTYDFLIHYNFNNSRILSPLRGSQQPSWPILLESCHPFGVLVRFLGLEDIKHKSSVAPPDNKPYTKSKTNEQIQNPEGVIRLRQDFGG
jgi:hypothetical protein